MQLVDLVPGDAPLVIGAHSFSSRLFVGTGKYASHEQMREAHLASGSECVTVALRRIDLGAAGSLVSIAPPIREPGQGLRPTPMRALFEPAGAALADADSYAVSRGLPHATRDLTPDLHPPVRRESVPPALVDRL